jgi:hypothetical protein
MTHTEEPKDTQIVNILEVWLERVVSLQGEVGGPTTRRGGLVPYQRLPELFASLDHAMGVTSASPNDSLEHLRAWRSTLKSS